MSCPVQIFKNNEFNKATAWLNSSDAGSNLKFELLDDGVLVVHPTGVLRREDFDKLSSVVDPWIETHPALQGLVICIHKFPGWENIGSFIHHISFVKAHHRKVRRIALAVDGILPKLVSAFSSHFVEAEIKQFSCENVKDAVAWVKS